MHMKKIIALLSVLALTLLASCGKAEEVTEEVTATGTEMEVTVESTETTTTEEVVADEATAEDVVVEEELTEEATTVEMN